jgi:hypothetical protein
MRRNGNNTAVLRARMIEALFAFKKNFLLDRLGMRQTIKHFGHAAAEIPKTLLDDLLLFLRGFSLAKRNIDAFFSNLALAMGAPEPYGNEDIGNKPHQPVRKPLKKPGKSI